MKPETFGDLLKRLREVRHVSQSRLAVRAGFDHSYISRLESGDRTPTRDAVERLGDALQLDLAEKDTLLAAAGFLPRDVSSLISGEPGIADALDFLSDETVDDACKEGVRLSVRNALYLGRMVAKGAAA